MIVYHKSKQGFSDDILTNDIDGIILNALRDKMGKSVGQVEFNSFRNSLSYKDKVLADPSIPNDCNISIYRISHSLKLQKGLILLL